MTPTPGVKIKLGGEPRTLRFDNEALVRLEEETGKTMGQVGVLLQQASLKTVTECIWAGVLHSSPDLTIRDVRAWVDLRRLEEITDAVDRAFALALGKDEGDASGEGKAEAAS